MTETHRTEYSHKKMNTAAKDSRTIATLIENANFLEVFSTKFAKLVKMYTV